MSTPGKKKSDVKKVAAKREIITEKHTSRKTLDIPAESEIVTLLKYDINSLREKYKLSQQEMLTERQSFADEIYSSKVEIQNLGKEKENIMSLLKTRNENELKLQCEILDKNSVIENLTKKLKESTHLILSINLKNTNINKGFSQKMTERLTKQKEELDLQF